MLRVRIFLNKNFFNKKTELIPAESGDKYNEKTHSNYFIKLKSYCYRF